MLLYILYAITPLCTYCIFAKQRFCIINDFYYLLVFYFPKIIFLNFYIHSSLWCHTAILTFSNGCECDLYKLKIVTQKCSLSKKFCIIVSTYNYVEINSKLCSKQNLIHKKCFSCVYIFFYFSVLF